MELSGRLASFPIAELLTWATNERRTGSLVLRRSSREKRIYFRGGQVVACLTDSTEEFYGKHLFLEGYLDHQTLLRCLLLCQETGKRLGEVLVDEGVLELPVVQRTLSEQIEDLICDVFLWHRGIFFFQADQPPDEEILAQPINTMALVLEGTRWVDQLKRIRLVLEHDHLLLHHKRGKKPRSLSPRAAVILRQLEGRMTIAQLHKTIGGSYFRFVDEACTLVEKGILQVLDEGMDQPTGTYELPLTKLLMEQAAEEQLPLALRDVAIPLHLLEAYYPVKAREVAAPEWERMSEMEKEFLARFDGKRPLAEILSQDREERSQETELLFLLISRGALAFIPPPVEEMEVAAPASEEE